MKRVLWITCATLAVLVFTSLVYAGPVPQLLNFQGRLNDNSGSPVTETKSMLFSLYSSATATSPLWQETQTVTVANGAFNAVLGSQTILPASVFNGAEVWLGIKVDPDTSELAPRQQITSVGYSLRAATADSVSTSATITAANQIVSTVPTGTSPLQVSSATMVANLNAEMVGGKRAGDLWQTGGNAGTTAGTNFIGTTDNQAVEIKVDGIRAYRIEPNGTSPNIIGGSSANAISAGVYGAVIGGGGEAISPNRVTDIYGFVGGGYSNTAGNDAGSAYDADHATVGGGSTNTAGNTFATVGGGGANTASGAYALVGGGGGNTASGAKSTIGGGYLNSASGDNASVLGGYNNRAAAAYATVSGGMSSAASGTYAVVGGGSSNSASGYQATVSGGSTNTASASYSSIGGGFSSTASGFAATVSGGSTNAASGGDSTVGGGLNNAAGGNYATVGGGQNNTASSAMATVGGGYKNSAGGNSATVSGGSQNTASGTYATVTGGGYNTASGSQAMVAGGMYNAAGGDYSFAAGNRAKVRDAATVGDANGDEGTFVWADSQASDFVSTGPNQFLIRASGGVGIGTNSPNRLLHIAHPTAAEMNLEATGGLADWKTWNFVVDGGTGAKQNLTFRILNDAGTGESLKSFILWNNGNATLAGTLTQSSDIRLKTDIQPLEDSLDKVLRLRGVTYRMKDDETNTRRIGVIAQEIEQEYPELVLTDDKGFKSVAYANITPVLIEAVKALKAENDELKARLDKQEQMIKALMAR